MKTNVLNQLLARINIYKGNLWQIAFLLFLFFWAFHIYSTDSKWLGIFVIVLLFLILLRVRYLIPLTALVIVFAIFQSPIMKTWSEVIRSNTAVLKYPGQTLSNLFTPATGTSVLPGQARRTVALLQAQHIERYQLSNQILNNRLIHERIIEMAWPKKIDRSSPYFIIFLDEEKHFQACTMIAKQKDVALEYCP